MLRPTLTLVLIHFACDLPEPDDPGAGVVHRAADPPTPNGEGDDKGAGDGKAGACSEPLIEDGVDYPTDHVFIPGLADLPLGGAACEALGADPDGDGVSEGQKSCDELVAPQGLPAGSAHFTVFPVGEGELQCGCTCAERPACAKPSHYVHHDDVGAGSYAKPFEIWTAAQLEDLAAQPTAWDRHYVQCRDIDMAPFYSASHPYFVVPQFSGSYDGRDHEIRRFTYDVLGVHYAPPASPDEERHVGLFAELRGAVSRLRLVEAHVRSPATDTESVGALAGRSEGADLWRLSVDSRVHGHGSTGGVVGAGQDTRASDLDVVSRVRTYGPGGGVFGRFQGGDLGGVTAVAEVEGDFSGGVVGWVQGARIVDVAVSGAVDAYTWGGGAFGYFGKSEGRRVAADVEVGSDTALALGGLIGGGFGVDVRESRASGDVVTIVDGGGFIGAVYGPGLWIRDSYATGGVATSALFSDSSGKLGGFLGGVWGGEAGDPERVIERCYAAGSVEGNFGEWPAASGGFVGDGGDARVRDSFALGAATGTQARAFGSFMTYPDPLPVDPSNRHNSDVNPGAVGQGTPASLASGVFSTPNANFGWSWPVGPGGWTFTPGQLPRLTDVP